MQEIREIFYAVWNICSDIWSLYLLIRLSQTNHIIYLMCKEFYFEIFKIYPALYILYICIIFHQGSSTFFVSTFKKTICIAISIERRGVFQNSKLKLKTNFKMLVLNYLNV